PLCGIAGDRRAPSLRRRATDPDDRTRAAGRPRADRNPKAGHHTQVKLYCATGNPGKLREFRAASERFGIEVLELPAFKEIPPCEETGRTFQENAILKATYYGRHAPGLLFADDSGLEVDALGGAPGVFSARYAGPGATDDM